MHRPRPLPFRDLRPFFLYTPFCPDDPVQTVYRPCALGRDQHEFFRQYDRVPTVLFRRGFRAAFFAAIDRVVAILVLSHEIPVRRRRAPPPRLRRPAPFRVYTPFCPFDPLHTV